MAMAHTKATCPRQRELRPPRLSTAPKVNTESMDELRACNIPLQLPKSHMKTTLTIIALLACGLAQAHSGGTDRQGCHMDRSTGIRHCH